MCERFCGCWGAKLYLLGRATFPSSPPSAREWRNTRRTPLPSREEPGSQEVSLGREQVEPGSKPPQSPTVAPKDLESDFITPRKRGKRRLSSDSSNSEGESLDSRTPLKMTRVGEDVMADTATTPPASPTDTIIPAATSGGDNVGKKSPNRPTSRSCANSAESQPCPQTEAGLPLQKGCKTGTTIPKPAPRQLPQEAIPATRAPAFVDFPVVIHDLGGIIRRRNICRGDRDCICLLAARRNCWWELFKP